VSGRTVLIAILALTFGTSAAIGVNALRNSWNGSNVVKVPVVVATGDIARFTTLSADYVKIREYPKELAPAGAFQKVEDIVDRVADAAFVRGEPLLESQLSPKGAGRGAAAVIPAGMRAVTIKTPNAESGVAGFILPGNKVDVLLTLKGNREDDHGGGSTSTLLQNVEILAVDQKVEAPNDNKVNLKELRSVTLLVTPPQANELDLGQNMGTLHLALRNPLDTKATASGQATLRTLRGSIAGSWDNRLRSVLEAAAKLAANRNVAKEKEKTAPVGSSQTPAPLTIRTLRGTHAGSVALD
jgi:pilus assembly protein CpaB